MPGGRLALAGMSTCELHVLCTPGRERWRALLKGDLADAPCRVRWLVGGDGIDALNRAHARAWEASDADYLGYVDDDDRVLPGAMEACIGALDAHPDAVGAYTAEQRIDVDGAVIRSPSDEAIARPWSRALALSHQLAVHHLWVGRRDSVLRYAADTAAMGHHAMWALTTLMAIDGPWIAVPMIGYQWRIHGGGIHRTAPPVDAQVVRKVAERVLRL